jgi:hypothetical protein
MAVRVLVQVNAVSIWLCLRRVPFLRQRIEAQLAGVKTGVAATADMGIAQRFDARHSMERHAGEGGRGWGWGWREQERLGREDN